jgi:hypothetical protein
MICLDSKISSHRARCARQHFETAGRKGEKRDVAQRATFKTSKRLDEYLRNHPPAAKVGCKICVIHNAPPVVDDELKETLV